jgi:hypothetical protein
MYDSVTRHYLADLGELQETLLADYRELIRETWRLLYEGKRLEATLCEKHAERIWECLSAEARRRCW